MANVVIFAHIVEKNKNNYVKIDIQVT